MKQFFALALTASLVSPGIIQANVPTLAETFTTDVYVLNGTSTQRSKIDRAEQKIKDVVRSEEFKNRVINFTYNGVKRFVDNGGLTNTQIYYKILNGAERLLPSKDNEMDLKIKTYYQNSSTVGWTTPSSMYINMNTKFLNQYSSNETAKTMVHEWLHKLGFTHSQYYSNSRNYSVPYGVGRIVMELASRY
jgi:3-oxoacyl-[acyl-carrier-protein] synthase III